MLLFRFMNKQKMAWILILIISAGASASITRNEMALANITRFAAGDLFSLVGTDCGLTRCMEISHGTALAAMGGGSDCVCQCRRETPAFREDHRICVNHIEECLMASFGRGSTKPLIPFVFLPLKGQIIYPSKEIIFTDVEDAICAVTSAQYLSPSGWVTLRDLVDNDVPFGLYRDEGSTYLQWRGSAGLHARLEGRLVAAHVLCSSVSPSRLAASCAAFRIAGATHSPLLDVRSIPFHAGETVTTEPATQGHGLSVLEALAIGVCVLMLIFVYAAGIIFYIHYKQKQKNKTKDTEMNLSNTLSTDNGSTLDSRIDMGSMRLKTNPLLNLESMRNEYMHESGLSDVSEHTEDTLDSSPSHRHKYQNSNSNVVSAMVHTRRKKPVRPSIRAHTSERVAKRLQRRSASPELEKAPHSDLSIIHCNSVEHHEPLSMSSSGEPAIRRKLYFNPAFFETELLKNPPPAAIEFLIKLREVMSIAKEKMISKRFIPILSDIPEEELYHTIDLGWDIPCARRGRRFSAISLKRENGRRAIHCGGCPGCDNSVKVPKSTELTRSNSCKTCVSDDYKQRIVQKWLDEVPSPTTTVTRPVKSVAKVSGTPRVVEPKTLEERPNLQPIRHRDEIRESPSHEELQPLKITETILRDYFNDVSQNNPTNKTDENKGTEKVIKNNLIIEEGAHKKDNFNLIEATISQERKSPSKHATRKIRKRLPPPPPPPTNHPPVEQQQNVTQTATVEEVPILPEVKKKMEAVIRELNKCKRGDSEESLNNKVKPIAPTPPKIVIPVIAADSHYFSDDNVLSNSRKIETHHHQENVIEWDSLERVNKRRRFSLDFGSELTLGKETKHINQGFQISRERLTRSWRDLKKTQDIMSNDNSQNIHIKSGIQNHMYTNNTFVHSSEPIYNNVETPGPLTIEVRGSPIENRRKINEDFDPDTLDRKPRRETKKCVEKILLKSGGSFKHKPQYKETEKRASPPEEVFTRKIGSLRQIYEAKTKAQNNDLRIHERRGSLPYVSQELISNNSVRLRDYTRSTDNHKDLKPPIPPKQRRGSDFSIRTNSSARDSPPSERQRLSEERDRFPPYNRAENLCARRSGRRSARTRSRRVDLRKLCRTEDSGYLSTDSNESKRRARHLLQLKPKFIQHDLIPKQMASSFNKTFNLPIDSDTDDFESLCDGRSESGGESVETDSVFFGIVEDSKQLYAELGLKSFQKLSSQDQIDSGFAGETNIILSGDSDSEHRSVISIIAGRDGRASASSVKNIDDSPYIQSVEC